MPLNNLVWWLIILLNLLGYFMFRFGIISRGHLRSPIEFLGGTLLTISFIVMFILFGFKSGLILIPIFWIITTPLTEISVGRIYKTLYGKSDKRIADKYNISEEKVKEEVYENIDNAKSV